MPPLDLKKENVKELKELVKKMRAVMNESNGVGLSANQIGVAKRIFVAQVPDEHSEIKFYAVVNPTITKKSFKKAPLEEGCLSTPNTYGVIERPERITLKGYTVDGKKLKIKAWGILAQVFQHEVGHLNGKLFTDKAKETHHIEPRSNN